MTCYPAATPLQSGQPDQAQPDTLPGQTSLSEEYFQVDRLPIISAFCHKIGIAQSINSKIDSNAEIDTGTLVHAMILDVLSGRTPLYRFEEFFKKQDTELLLGRAIPAERFTDDSLGRGLDRLHQTGTLKIFTDISLKACRIFGVDTSQGHYDTTSVSLWGDYDNSSANDGPAPHITHGYSKDKRPDLKQFMFSLLCVEGNIPLLGKVEDGNGSDGKLNNEELQQVARLIGESKLERDNFLYVADCKLVNRDNLEVLGDNPFVSRLPASYKVHQEAVAAALAQDEWELIGTLNETPASKKRPAAVYKIAERAIQLYGREYRAIVVHSSNLDKRRQKRIDREVNKARSEAEKAVKKARREIFSCQQDADKALHRLRAELAGGLWQIGQSEVVPKKIYVSGKVAAGKERATKRIDYTLRLEVVEDEAEVALLRERAGCFVLLSNAPAGTQAQAEASVPRAWSGAQCLRAYKEQYGIENNFSFLKEPLIVNDVFLKKPGRIDALGMVMLLSLLVWSLMQRSLRQSVTEQPDLQLTDLDNKPTRRPTSFILMHKFLKVLVLKEGTRRRLAWPLTLTQRQYLQALDLDYRVFTVPPKLYQVPPL